MALVGVGSAALASNPAATPTDLNYATLIPAHITFERMVPEALRHLNIQSPITIIYDEAYRE